ncbi:MAG: hypothetical protein BGO27_04055 [Alphaproteobacteria bacterium 33-17]|nr:MAG: hypothetical protein BGO27_04055 [Alphaproteobacteria bacterium 33-17]
MGKVVLKFGGTSMGSVERILNAAQIVKEEIAQNNDVAVVVSAMSGTTDSLINLVKSFSNLNSQHELAEYDSIIATGETISAGLMVLALESIGIKATSLQGWQLPIKTNAVHSKAFISDINPSVISTLFQNKIVPVITGFQGINDNNRITTLGRGGSDTTAVAIAASLSADKCDIYTDVDGVYTADPRIIPLASKIEKLTYDEMIEMASLGSKVLQVRSVTIAKEYNVGLNVLSSFSRKSGTSIIKNYDGDMENNNVRGISLVSNEARVSINNIDPENTQKVYEILQDKSITIDIVQISENLLEFNIPNTELDIFLDSLNKTVNNIEINVQKAIVKISLVGMAIKSNPAVMNTIFSEALKCNTKILKLASSEMKISIIVKAEEAEQFVRCLHSAYGLDVTIS